MNATESIWEDREIRFDVRSNLLSCRQGEMIVDSINSVEDTKGNNGERGSLIVTNLRIIWVRVLCFIFHENSSFSFFFVIYNDTFVCLFDIYWIGMS